MARPALVLDASVGVKWFSTRDEGSLAQALAIRDGHVIEEVLILVPDLFYYEVANALVHKRHMSVEAVHLAVNSLLDAGLQTFSASSELMVSSTTLARQFNISVYDACYIALARRNGCALVTANPRHHRQDMGCRVIPIEEWPPGPG